MKNKILSSILILLLCSCEKKDERISTPFLKPNFEVSADDIIFSKVLIDLGENVYGTKRPNQLNYGYVLNGNSEIIAQYWQEPIEPNYTKEEIINHYEHLGCRVFFKYDKGKFGFYSFIVKDLKTNLYFSGVKTKIDLNYYLVTTFEFPKLN